MGLLIMKNYLAIIRKLDFVDLFKYGQFNISNAVQFEGDLSDHASDDELFDVLTSKMNMFQYSFEYLIVHFMAKDNINQCITIDIRNVIGLYTFDEEAKKEMSISFDPRIQLHVSPWADKFEKLQQKLSMKQSLRGVDNLWAIFDLPEEDRIRCEQIIKADDVQEVFRELYAHERPSGNKSIWIYLLRYERHSFYPPEMLGFFCDFMHVYCNFLKNEELNGEVVESTDLYQQLMACNNPQFAPLLQIVNASRLPQLTEQVSGCRFAIVAPLFLFLKSRFAEGMDHKPDDKIISYAKNVGEFECSVAVYLLGIALGYDKTYDAFYETSELAFFKQSKKVDIPFKANGGLETTASRFIKEDKVLDTAINSNNESLPFQWMCKKLKGRITDVRPVKDKEEYVKYTQLGYEAVTKYTSTVKDTIISYGLVPEAERKRLKNVNKK